MPTIIWRAGLFEGGNRKTSEDTILKLLAVLVDRNCQYLRANPKTPKLYDSGVVYALPDQMTKKPSEDHLARLVQFMSKDMALDEETIEVIETILHGCEVFRDIPMILKKREVDCFPLSQRVIVRSCSTGMYELLTLGELRHVYPHYEALSYNFSKCRYEFQPITGFHDGGVKPVSRARLSNGTDLVATNDHRFWTLDGPRHNLHLNERTMGEYVQTYIDHKKGRISKSARTEHSRILQAAKIPSLDAVKVSQSQAYLAGMYAAEGYHNGKHATRIAQYKPSVRAKIEASLHEEGVAYAYGGSEGKTPGSGKEYRLHGGAANPIVAMMRGQGRDSFSKRLPQFILSSDEATIARAMEGHGDGDAWRPGTETSKYERPNISAIYATSSDELMEQLRLGALILGRPTYAYQYEDHGGSGSSPIWRLHEYNDKASKLHSREALLADDLPGVRYATVRNAVPAGEEHVACIEVDGNHNFILADGTIVHNCDNLACFRVAELRCGGIEAVPYIIWRETGRGTTYHALLRWPDGSSEDPSLILGMGGAAREADRTEEKRKNRERYDNMIAMARELCNSNLTTPIEVGKRIDALGLLPTGGW